MNIYESISAVMGEIGAVGKNSKNQQQGFMFRGIDAVMNAINPALTKYKVFIVPEVMEQTREERINVKGTLLIYSICKVKYTFYAEDGSYIQSVVIGEGMDTGDKATNKAMSIAFKYACFQVFCIPTEEMKDPDAESHNLVNKTTQEASSNKPTDTQNAQSDKITDLQVKSLLKKYPKQEQIKNILDHFNIKKLEDMTVAQLSELINGKKGE